jgi:hypothetical protein
MLFSHDFIRAEDKYRREVMRDQARKGNHVFAKTATAIVVAALLVTACGDPVSETGQPSSQRFLEVNTSALDALVPAASGSAAAIVDEFLYLNTTALDAIAPKTALAQPPTDRGFIYWNTTSLEYPGLVDVEADSGPR